MVTKVTNCKLELTIINKVLARLDRPRHHIFAPSETDTELGTGFVCGVGASSLSRVGPVSCEPCSVLTRLGCV